MAIGCFVVEISQVFYHCHKGFSVSESTSCPKVVSHTLGPKILFCDCIDALRLTIGLGVEGSTRGGLYSKAGSKVSPKASDELRTTVGDKVVGEAVVLEDILDGQLGETLGVDGGVAGDQVALLR
jgi:hypothetical protein